MVKLRRQRVGKKDPGNQQIRGARRCNTDYSHGYAIEVDGLAYDSRIGVKLALPQRLAEYGYLRSRPAIALARGKEPANPRMINSENVKVVAACQQCADVPVSLFKKCGILSPCRHLTQGVRTAANGIVVFCRKGSVLVRSCKPPSVSGTDLNETRRVNTRGNPE